MQRLMAITSKLRSHIRTVRNFMTRGSKLTDLNDFKGYTVAYVDASVTTAVSGASHTVAGGAVGYVVKTCGGEVIVERARWYNVIWKIQDLEVIAVRDGLRDVPPNLKHLPLLVLSDSQTVIEAIRSVRDLREAGKSFSDILRMKPRVVMGRRPKLLQDPDFLTIASEIVDLLNDFPPESALNWVQSSDNVADALCKRARVHFESSTKSFRDGAVYEETSN